MSAHKTFTLIFHYHPCALLLAGLLCLMRSATPSLATQSTSTQMVLAWGNNASGELGDGTKTNRSLPVAITDKGVLSGKTVTQISAGFSHTVALCSDGTLASWGNNADESLPVAVTGGALSGKTVIKISAGCYHTLALCSDGTLASWGPNVYGELGDGTGTSSALPVDITHKGALNGKTVIQIYAGYFHSFALCSDGSLLAWGLNRNGQLGDGSTETRFLPTSITSGVLSGKSVIQIGVGRFHTLALCSDGTLASWGNNGNGQLGDGTTGRNFPVAINNEGALIGQTILQIATGEGHNLALCSNDSLVAWGYNSNGQLGDGTKTERPLPVEITGGALNGKSIIQISAGYFHTLALCSDGTLLSWGYNSSGQLGIGSNTDSYLPVTIRSGARIGQAVTRIVSGYAYNIVLSVAETTKPTVTLSTPSANQKISLSNFGSDSISGSAADDLGVTAVKVRISRKRNGINSFWNGTDFVLPSLTFVDAPLIGSTSATWSLGTNTPPANKLDDGLYGVRVYAIDAAGNQSAPVDRFFTLVNPLVDKTAPTITITSPTSNQVFNIGDFNSSSLSGTATDNVGVTRVELKLQRKVGDITYFWNGTDFTPTVAKFDATVTTVGGTSVTWQLAQAIAADKLTKGGYTLYATAYDAAGNFKTSPSRIFAIIGTPAASDATPAANSAGHS